jgi:Ca2+-binding EF-hand superfamily protein
MSDVPQTELEKQMAELMSGISNVAEGANTAKKSAAKTRRRSRDLEVQLGEMAEGQKDLHSLVRVRRKSKDFDEKELKDIFDEIDTDKTGKLDKTELLKAFRKAEPTATEKQVEDMIKFADKNGDGEVDFEEFHKALTTKPEGAPSAAS